MMFLVIKISRTYHKQSITITYNFKVCIIVENYDRLRDKITV